MSLVTTTAFKHNPALQPRAFVALGSLARLNRVNDELLLFQILISLVDALNAFQEDDNELIVAIIMCLQRITPNMPKYAPHYPIQKKNFIFYFLISTIKRLAVPAVFVLGCRWPCSDQPR